jgi:hypothetical protein
MFRMATDVVPQMAQMGADQTDLSVFICVHLRIKHLRPSANHSSEDCAWPDNIGG